eukprot:jgi/Bigna1/139888/aug1.53_g14596
MRRSQGGEETKDGFHGVQARHGEELYSMMSNPEHVAADLRYRIDGQLTNLGVLAALILSFVVGLIYAMGMDEMTIGDYRARIMTDATFRRYSLTLILSTFAVDVLRRQNFNFTVDLGESQPFNVEAALLQTYDFDPELDETRAVFKLDAAFHLTRTVFPMNLVSAYERVRMENGAYSAALGGTYGGISSATTLMVLAFTLIMYTANSLSNPLMASSATDVDTQDRDTHKITTLKTGKEAVALSSLIDEKRRGNSDYSNCRNNVNNTLSSRSPRKCSLDCSSLPDQSTPQHSHRVNIQSARGYGINTP